MNGERNHRVALSHFESQLGDPLRLQAEDIVREPEVIGRQRALDQGHLLGDVGRRAHGVAPAPDGLRAPVAVERAAAGGHQVEAVAAVRLPPGRAVALDVEQVPSGKGKRSGWRSGSRGRRPPHAAVGAGVRQDEPATASTGRAERPVSTSSSSRSVWSSLAAQPVLDAGREVRLRMVGQVGAAASTVMPRSRASRLMRQAASRA